MIFVQDGAFARDCAITLALVLDKPYHVFVDERGEYLVTSFSGEDRLNPRLANAERVEKIPPHYDPLEGCE